MYVMALRAWPFALLAAFALAAAVMMTMVPAAYAHPVTIDSSPKPFASVASGPREVVVIFSEPIELSYSKISVLGPDGSRVDTNDPRHADGDTATLAVSLQPSLPEGVYTVTTKVLSAVDGHVVDGAITFGIGTAPTPGGGGGNPTGAPSEIISPAESASRFPGMVGQVMVVGAAFGTLWLWRPLDRVPWLSSAVATKRPAIDRAMLKIVIIGAALVLASNVAIITVQAIDIGASIADAIATRFGSVWMTRMIESSILMIIAFAVWRKAAKNNMVPSRAEVLAILVMGLAVLVTSSLIAHAAATENVAAILIDFFHNAAASIWIGGLILMGFVAVPRLLSLTDERARSAAVSILIPRFSTVVVTILGLVLITGPLLLFFIESDLSLTLASTYGKILATKLGLAGVMVAMGAYSQFAVQKKAVTAMMMAGGGGSSSIGVGRFGRMLKAEAGVGIALLLMVSLMANGALPAGEFPQHQRQAGQAAFAAETAASKHYVQTIYTSAGRVDLSIDPFVVGQNKFTLSFFDNDGSGSAAQDVEEATIKLTQVEKNIGPIAVDTKKASPGVFAADAAFSLPGTWLMEIEGVRPTSENIVAGLDVEVRPAISSLSFDLKEYKIPPPSLPLYPVVDEQRQSVWAGDSLPRSGRIWQLDMETGNYTAHPIANVTLVTQVVVDPSGKLWYIDPTESKLGLYDPDAKTNVQYVLTSRGIISGITQDAEGNLWMPVVQANQVVKFSPAGESFAQFDIPTPNSRPVGIAADSSGSNIWLAESTGRIARIQVSTGEIEEFEPAGANKLVVPTAVFPDPDGHDIYISEHDGHTVTAFNPLFHTFREYPQLNEGGLPFGMAQDAFGNLWYAQHEIDRIAVIDPRTGEGTEVKIPTSGSFVQWLASDEKGRIWFAEQRGAAIGVVTVTARPQIPPQPGGGEEPEQPGTGVPDLGFSLADAAGPAIVAGIVLSALFYAKSASDLKRNVRAAEKLGQ
jgi:copper transport protein